MTLLYTGSREGHEVIDKKLEAAALTILRLQFKQTAGRSTLWYFTALSRKELDYYELVLGEVIAVAVDCTKPSES